jgi:hypothetical protein
LRTAEKKEKEKEKNEGKKAQLKHKPFSTGELKALDVLHLKNPYSQIATILL